jgi:SAM-dependent methyltransferase
MGYWGELYVRSTEPFFSEANSCAEANYLEWCFATHRVAGPILDLGCGRGRHAVRMQSLTGRPLIGLDRDPYTVERRLPGFSAIQADFRLLPFKNQSLAGAYAWYNTLFNVDQGSLSGVLHALARAFKEGGRLVLQGDLFTKRPDPEYRFEHTFGDGARLLERAVFDPENDRDQIDRTLQLPDGRVLQGSMLINYYSTDMLRHLLEMAGFEVKWIHGGTDRSPLQTDSKTMIVAADVRHG